MLSSRFKCEGRADSGGVRLRLVPEASPGPLPALSLSVPKESVCDDNPRGREDPHMWCLIQGVSAFPWVPHARETFREQFHSRAVVTCHAIHVSSLRWPGRTVLNTDRLTGPACKQTPPAPRPRPSPESRLQAADVYWSLTASTFLSP